MASEPLLNCGKCGRPVPPDSSSGCCPVCMAEMALRMGANQTTLVGDPRVIDCLELAPHFPGLQIIKLLGSGGMGAVYLAHQPKLDRDVALKILHPTLATDPEFAERFFREARVLAKLNHPNIVTVHDVDQAGPYLYLLMEYVEGATLRELMLTGRIEPAEALRMVPRICEAIQYAHDRGVVHRDIKPENILLNEQGAVKIADFGLAKLVGPIRDNLTSTQARMGTPHYMAPEQVKNTSNVDHRADIYSLGVTFYEMLTGQLPAVDYQPPSSKTDVGSEVDRIVGRSLKSVPDERYQRASEMQVDVEREAYRHGRTSGLAWGAILSAAAFLIIAAGVFAVWDRRPQGAGTLAETSDKSVGKSTVEKTDVEKTTVQAKAGSVADTASMEKPSSEGRANIAQHPPPIAVAKAPDSPNTTELFSDKWTWSHPVNLGTNVNSKANDSQPCLSADLLTLIFSSDRSPDGSWTQDLWQCRRPNITAPWGPAEKLPFPVNTPAFESDPALSGDGLHLAFVSNRPGGFGEMDIWLCHRDTPESAWKRAENAGPTVNTPASEALGALLFFDDMELFFSSPRDPNVRHGLWVVRRNNPGEPFGPAEAMRLAMTSSERLANPCFSPDCRVLFWTGRSNSEHGPKSQLDLFYSFRTRYDTPIPEGTRLEGTINSISGDIGPFLAWDRKTLLFESDRDGTVGQGDIWMTQRIPVDELRAQTSDQNYALAFDGDSTVVEIPTLARETQGTFTLEAWVRGKVPDSAKVLFAIGGTGRCQINLEVLGWCACDLFLTLLKTTPAFHGNPTDWTHVAYVVDEKEGTLYVNGKEVSRVPKSVEPMGQDGIPLRVSWIGGHPGVDGVTPNFLFQGEIDEARVSNIARYSAGFTPERKFTPDADTAALYHFDEGRGDRLMDSSGHDHHGTIRVPYWVRVSKD